MSARSGHDPSYSAGQANAPGTAAGHDEAGRVQKAPYVPSGRDERGRPVPPVPHEGFLGRLGTALLLGQSVVLAVVAVWTFVASTVSPSAGPVEVLGLRMTVAHGILLAVTAALATAACATRRWARRWSVTQFVVYLVVFFAGMTVSAEPVPGLELNGPDHALHAALALLGFVTAMLLSARIVEPRRARCLTPPDGPTTPTPSPVAPDPPRPREEART